MEKFTLRNYKIIIEYKLSNSMPFMEMENTRIANIISTTRHCFADFVVSLLESLSCVTSLLNFFYYFYFFPLP